ncbi:competence protein ComEC [Clostridium tetanomorphum]|uniref:ComEC/Rec2 family competence protein n=1 Tax=Clostridium tetanomorphum TaxID=1553 RepID=UPI00044DC8C7|nr:ComEC/Rec2 family competence protein [Clostridium tetanomorphum]KAJ51771.1 competence protein ComE [Clostridium tetanomorphum DSM 665]MBP1865006.1 competence protein ComEC [Clostridium tetanomorphum]NRS83397.1 competence protein ComEC [Clostridium tetanomorphum]
MKIKNGILKNNLFKTIQTIISVIFMMAAVGCTNTANPTNNKSTNKNLEQKKEASKTNNDKSGNNLKVHYINVGQGDSILLQYNNKNMLIDAGQNAASNTVVNYLKKAGIKKIDYLVATHPHEDHIGGIDKVIDNFNIGTMYMPKKTANTKTFRDVVQAMKKKGIKAKAPIAGEKFTLGDVKCTILAPNSDKYDNVNNYSIVIKATYGENSFLFTGDAESLSEKEIMNKNFDIQADVLKLGHHGSRTSSSTAFLNKVNPKYAVACLEKGNDYGHPHKETVNKLKDKGIKLYRTDENGDIVVTSDGKNIKFSSSPGSYNSVR